MFAERMWILRRATTSTDTMPASYGGSAVVLGAGLRWMRGERYGRAPRSSRARASICARIFSNLLEPRGDRVARATGGRGALARIVQSATRGSRPSIVARSIDVAEHDDRGVEVGRRRAIAGRRGIAAGRRRVRLSPAPPPPPPPAPPPAPPPPAPPPGGGRRHLGPAPMRPPTCRARASPRSRAAADRRRAGRAPRALVLLAQLVDADEAPAPRCRARQSAPGAGARSRAARRPARRAPRDRRADRPRRRARRCAPARAWPRARAARGIWRSRPRARPGARRELGVDRRDRRAPRAAERALRGRQPGGHRRELGRGLVRLGQVIAQLAIATPRRPLLLEPVDRGELLLVALRNLSALARDLCRPGAGRRSSPRAPRRCAAAGLAATAAGAGAPWAHATAGAVTSDEREPNRATTGSLIAPPCHAELPGYRRFRCRSVADRARPHGVTSQFPEVAPRRGEHQVTQRGGRMCGEHRHAAPRRPAPTPGSRAPSRRPARDGGAGDSRPAPSSSPSPPAAADASSSGRP